MAINAKLALSVENVINRYLNEFDTMPEEALKLRIMKDKKNEEKKNTTKLASYAFENLKSIEIPNIQYYLKKKCGESTEDIPKFITYDHPKNIKLNFKNVKFNKKIVTDLANFIYKISNVLMYNITQYTNKTILNEKYETKEKLEKKDDVYTVREQFILELMRNMDGVNPIIWNKVEQILKKDLIAYDKLVEKYKEEQLLRSKVREEKQKAKKLLRKEEKEKEKQAIKEAHEKGEIYNKAIIKTEREKAHKYQAPTPSEFMISNKEDNKEVKDYHTSVMKTKSYYHILSVIIGFLEKFLERRETIKNEFPNKTSDERFRMNLFEEYNDKVLYNELFYKEIMNFPISSSPLTADHKKILTSIVSEFKKKYEADKAARHEVKVVKLIDDFTTFKRDFAEYQKSPLKTKSGKDKVFIYKKNQATLEFFDKLKSDPRCAEIVEYVENNKDNRFMLIESKDKKTRPRNYEHNLSMIPILKEMFDNIPTIYTNASIGGTTTTIKISHGAFVLINNIINAMFVDILNKIILALEMRKNTSLIINDDIYVFAINAFMKDVGMHANVLDAADYYSRNMFIKY